jgi:hypothetical protein
MIAYPSERTMLDNELLSGLPLYIGVLNAEQAGRSQQSRGLSDHHFDRIQPILAGEQCDQRIMITYFGYHRFESFQWDVGRVGDHQVDCGVELRKGADHVLHMELHGGVREIPRRIGRRLFRQLDCMNPGPGQFRGYGFGDCTRSRAELDNHWQAPRLTARDRVDHRTQLLDRPAGHHLGLGSGHEDARAHLHLQVAKVSATSQVLQWHPMRTLVNQCLEAGGLGIIDGIEQRKPSQLDSCCVRQQLPSILLSRGDADLAQLARSLMQQRSNSHAHGFAPPTWESRSWVSASWSALITASRSPFST